MSQPQLNVSRPVASFPEMGVSGVIDLRAYAADGGANRRLAHRPRDARLRR